jgi:hypothetical protein
MCFRCFPKWPRHIKTAADLIRALDVSGEPIAVQRAHVRAHLRSMKHVEPESMKADLTRRGLL